MFSGIIEITAQVIENKGNRLDLTNPFGSQTLSLGQSIAVNGCCLTLCQHSNTHLSFDLSNETLSKTAFAQLKPTEPVNLERAIKLGERLDGHMVSGHVDGTVKILDIHSSQDFCQLTIELPKKFSPFISPKGSITLDGVSLTINDVRETEFTLTLVPHTLQVTHLKNKKIGNLLNFEVDLVARHIWNMLPFTKEARV